ncbi:MAG: NADH-quinone oxidoreductase subunit NuoG [Actinobacteria bacterium]|nr:NADH-quinone oxidoreductase subunit NuoG [Actinomycetota bacterium]
MPEATNATDTLTITVDGKEIEARPGELLIDAAERVGIYIPRFCYHPRMRPVGMCRMCLVEIDTGRGAALQPACMAPVAPGMNVTTDSRPVVKAQDGVLEFLLVNHPLDCPVCDKGGECPLQDQTMAYGPGESRMIEEKRHFEKPIPISDLVTLDRERCILCDRCTRFAKEVAGDPLIHFLDRGGQTQVNTFPDHPFASYFSGNTVQICPVGALTATPYRFRARPWDLQQTESTCTSCSVGCRVVVDSSRNRMLRMNGVDIDPVNWSWLCDKGRFDFQAFESDDRLHGPLVRRGSELVPVRWSEALNEAASAIREGLDRSGPAGVAVLGGARLTNEAAYAWAKLTKGVIGTDHVDCQLGDGLPAEVVLGLPRATIDQACARGGTVVLLAPDLKEELPVLYLRLRHAVLEDAATVIELAPAATTSTELAAASLRHRPGEQVTVVRALLDGGPAPQGADEDGFRRAAEALRRGPVTVVIGRSSVAEGAGAVVDAAAALLAGLDEVRFLPALRRGNVHGALDMGLAPGVLPGRTALADGRDWFAGEWGAVPVEPGLDATGILRAAADGRIDTLVLLGADPIADFPDHVLAERALAGARTVIALDTFLTASSSQADVVLAAAGYGEVDGTTTNLEGRVSTLGRIVTPPGTARSDWHLAGDLARRLGADLGLESVEATWAEIERVAPSHAGVTWELLTSPEASDGVVVPLPSRLSATEVDVEGNALGGSDVSVVGGAGVPAADVQHGQAAAAAVASVAAEGGPQGEAGKAESHAHESAAAAHEDSTDVSAEERGHDDAGGVEGQDDVPVAEPPPGDRPSLLRFAPPAAEPSVPPVDRYSLRLFTTRKLYDRGTLNQQARALRGLAGRSTARVNPIELARLGVEPGGALKISSARGSLVTATLADPDVPRGAIVLGWNLDGPDPGDLIDAEAPVTDVRVETTS